MMAFANRHALPALALAVAVTSVQAETTTLRFRWPAGLDAGVSFSGWRERLVDERRERRAIEGRYAMTTRRVADGLLIDVSGMAVETPQRSGAQGAGSIQDAVERLSNVLPDVVIDDNGALVRIAGAQETADAVRAAIDAALADAPEKLRARMSEALGALLSPARIEATVRGNWGRDIGVWAGLIVEPGRRYEGEVSVPVPMLPGVKAPASVHYALTGFAPCPAPARERTCAALEMRTSVSDADAKTVVERLGASLSARAGRAVRVESLSLDSEVRLLAEPATLLPHVVEFEQGTAITLVSQGAPTRTVEQREQRRTEYRYR